MPHSAVADLLHSNDAYDGPTACRVIIGDAETTACLPVACIGFVCANVVDGGTALHNFLKGGWLHAAKHVRWCGKPLSAVAIQCYQMHTCRTRIGKCVGGHSSFVCLLQVYFDCYVCCSTS